MVRTHKFSPSIRIVAALTLFFFITTNFEQRLYASSSELLPKVTTGSTTLDLTHLKIPENFGTLQDRFFGKKSSHQIVLIQDAHEIPEAQRNIEKLIEYLSVTYGVRSVMLEGASEKLDSHIFQSFPDQKRLREVFEDYYERGELTGGTAAAIFERGARSIEQGDKLQAPSSMPRAEFSGIEDWHLYEEGLGLYQEAMKSEEQLLKVISDQWSVVREEKKKVYSKELLEIDQAMEKFYENKSDLIETLKVLAKFEAPSGELALILKRSVVGDQWSGNSSVEIKRLAGEIEKLLRGKKIEDRKEKLEGNLTSNLKPLTSLTEFNLKKQSYNTSQISEEAYSLYLTELAKKLGTGPQFGPVPGLLKAAEEERRLQNIQGTKLFKEFEEYINQVVSREIASSPTAPRNDVIASGAKQSLYEKTKELRLLSKLIKLELTREEWQAFKKIENRGEKLETADFFLISNIKLLTSHINFYKNAEAREKAFLKNLEKKYSVQGTAYSELKRSTHDASRSTIIVAGGFHTEGLAAALKSKNISYAVITPVISQVPGTGEPGTSPYREHMKGNVSWKNYFEVRDGKVNLYEAFVRATRDQLISKSQGTGHKSQEEKPVTDDFVTSDPLILKNWRDQIIRDLAAKNELTRASDYTRFIDELSEEQGAWGMEKNSKLSAPSTMLRSKWLSNIEKFIGGLRGLKSSNQLTETNVLKLLQTPTVPSSFVNASNLVPTAWMPILNTEVRSGVQRETLVKDFVAVSPQNDDLTAKPVFPVGFQKSLKSRGDVLGDRRMNLNKNNPIQVRGKKIQKVAIAGQNDGLLGLGEAGQLIVAGAKRRRDNSVSGSLQKFDRMGRNIFIHEEFHEHPLLGKSDKFAVLELIGGEAESRFDMSYIEPREILFRGDFLRGKTGFEQFQNLPKHDPSSRNDGLTMTDGRVNRNQTFSHLIPPLIWNDNTPLDAGQYSKRTNWASLQTHELAQPQIRKPELSISRSEARESVAHHLIARVKAEAENGRKFVNEGKFKEAKKSFEKAADVQIEIGKAVFERDFVWLLKFCLEIWGKETQTVDIFEESTLKDVEYKIRDVDTLKKFLIASLMLSSGYYRNKLKLHQLEPKKHGVINDFDNLKISGFKRIGKHRLPTGNETSSGITEFEDPETKKKYFLKFTNGRIVAEVLGSWWFERLGFSTVDTRIVNFKNRPAVITKKIEGVQTLYDYVYRKLIVPSLFKDRIIEEFLFPNNFTHLLRNSKLADIVIELKDEHLRNILLRVDENEELLGEAPIFIDREASFGYRVNPQTGLGMIYRPYREGITRQVIDSGYETAFTGEMLFHRDTKFSDLNSIAEEISRVSDSDIIAAVERTIRSGSTFSDLQLPEEFSPEVLSRKWILAIESVRSLYDIRSEAREDSKGQGNLEAQISPEVTKKRFLIVEPNKLSNNELSYEDLKMLCRTLLNLKGGPAGVLGMDLSNPGAHIFLYRSDGKKFPFDVVGPLVFANLYEAQTPDAVIESAKKMWQERVERFHDNLRSQVVYALPMNSTDNLRAVDPHNVLGLGELLSRRQETRNSVAIEFGSGPNAILSLAHLRTGGSKAKAILVENKPEFIKLSRIILQLNGYQEGVDYEVMEGDLTKKDFLDSITTKIKKDYSQEPFVSFINLGQKYPEATRNALELSKKIPNIKFIFDGGYWTDSVGREKEKRSYWEDWGAVGVAELPYTGTFAFVYDPKIQNMQKSSGANGFTPKNSSKLRSELRMNSQEEINELQINPIRSEVRGLVLQTDSIDTLKKFGLDSEVIEKLKSRYDNIVQLIQVFVMEPNRSSSRNLGKMRIRDRTGLDRREQSEVIRALSEFEKIRLGQLRPRPQILEKINLGYESRKFVGFREMMKKLRELKGWRHHPKTTEQAIREIQIGLRKALLPSLLRAILSRLSHEMQKRILGNPWIWKCIRFFIRNVTQYQLLLFGGYADGRQNEWSDLDLIFVGDTNKLLPLTESYQAMDRILAEQLKAIGLPVFEMGKGVVFPRIFPKASILKSFVNNGFFGLNKQMWLITADSVSHIPRPETAEGARHQKEESVNNTPPEKPRSEIREKGAGEKKVPGTDLGIGKEKRSEVRNKGVSESGESESAHPQTREPAHSQTGKSETGASEQSSARSEVRLFDFNVFDALGNSVQSQSKRSNPPRSLGELLFQTFYFLSFMGSWSAKKSAPISKPTVPIINKILSVSEEIFPNVPPIIIAINNAWKRVSNVFDKASSLFTVQNTIILNPYFWKEFIPIFIISQLLFNYYINIKFSSRLEKPKKGESDSEPSEPANPQTGSLPNPASRSEVRKTDIPGWMNSPEKILNDPQIVNEKNFKTALKLLSSKDAEARRAAAQAIPMFFQAIRDQSPQFRKKSERWNRLLRESMRFVQVEEDEKKIENNYSLPIEMFFDVIRWFGRLRRHLWNYFTSYVYRHVYRLSKSFSNLSTASKPASNNIYTILNKFYKSYPYLSYTFRRLRGDDDFDKSYLAQVRIDSNNPYQSVVRLSSGWRGLPKSIRAQRAIENGMEMILDQMRVVLEVSAILNENSSTESLSEWTNQRDREEHDLKAAHDNKEKKEIIKNRIFFAVSAFLAPLIAFFSWIILVAYSDPDNQKSLLSLILEIIFDPGAMVMIPVITIVVIAILGFFIWLFYAVFDLFINKKEEGRSGLVIIDDVPHRSFISTYNERGKTVVRAQIDNLTEHDQTSDTHPRSIFINYESSLGRFIEMAKLLKPDSDDYLEKVFLYKIHVAELRFLYDQIGQAPLELDNSWLYSAYSDYLPLRVEILPGNFLFITRDFNTVRATDGVRSVAQLTQGGREQMTEIPFTFKEMIRDRQNPAPQGRSWVVNLIWKMFGLIWIIQVFERGVLYLRAKYALRKFLKQVPYPTRARILIDKSNKLTVPESFVRDGTKWFVYPENKAPNLSFRNQSLKREGKLWDRINKFAASLGALSLLSLLVATGIQMGPVFLGLFAHGPIRIENNFKSGVSYQYGRNSEGEKRPALSISYTTDAPAKNQSVFYSFGYFESMTSQGPTKYVSHYDQAQSILTYSSQTNSPVLGTMNQTNFLETPIIAVPHHPSSDGKSTESVYAVPVNVKELQGHSVHQVSYAQMSGEIHPERLMQYLQIDVDTFQRMQTMLKISPDASYQDKIAAIKKVASEKFAYSNNFWWSVYWGLSDALDVSFMDAIDGNVKNSAMKWIYQKGLSQTGNKVGVQCTGISIFGQKAGATLGVPTRTQKGAFDANGNNVVEGDELHANNSVYNPETKRWEDLELTSVLEKFIEKGKPGAKATSSLLNQAGKGMGWVMKLFLGFLVIAVGFVLIAIYQVKAKEKKEKEMESESEAEKTKDKYDEKKTSGFLVFFEKVRKFFRGVVVEEAEPQPEPTVTKVSEGNKPQKATATSSKVETQAPVILPENLPPVVSTPISDEYDLMRDVYDSMMEAAQSIEFSHAEINEIEDPVVGTIESIAFHNDFVHFHTDKRVESLPIHKISEDFATLYHSGRINFVPYVEGEETSLILVRKHNKIWESQRKRLLPAETERVYLAFPKIGGSESDYNIPLKSYEFRSLPAGKYKIEFIPPSRSEMRIQRSSDSKALQKQRSIHWGIIAPAAWGVFSIIFLAQSVQLEVPTLIFPAILIGISSITTVSFFSFFIFSPKTLRRHPGLIRLFKIIQIILWAGFALIFAAMLLPLDFVRLIPLQYHLKIHPYFIFAGIMALLNVGHNFVYALKGPKGLAENLLFLFSGKPTDFRSGMGGATGRMFKVFSKRSRSEVRYEPVMKVIDAAKGRQQALDASASLRSVDLSTRSELRSRHYWAPVMKSGKLKSDVVAIRAPSNKVEEKQLAKLKKKLSNRHFPEVWTHQVALAESRKLYQQFKDDFRNQIEGFKELNAEDQEVFFEDMLHLNKRLSDIAIAIMTKIAKNQKQYRIYTQSLVRDDAGDKQRDVVAKSKYYKETDSDLARFTMRQLVNAAPFDGHLPDASYPSENDLLFLKVFNSILETFVKSDSQTRAQTLASFRQLTDEFFAKQTLLTQWDLIHRFPNAYALRLARGYKEPESYQWSKEHDIKRPIFFTSDPGYAADFGDFQALVADVPIESIQSSYWLTESPENEFLVQGNILNPQMIAANPLSVPDDRHKALVLEALKTFPSRSEIRSELREGSYADEALDDLKVDFKDLLLNYNAKQLESMRQHVEKLLKGLVFGALYYDEINEMLEARSVLARSGDQLQGHTNREGKETVEFNYNASVNDWFYAYPSHNVKLSLLDQALILNKVLQSRQLRVIDLATVRGQKILEKNTKEQKEQVPGTDRGPDAKNRSEMRTQWGDYLADENQQDPVSYLLKQKSVVIAKKFIPEVLKAFNNDDVLPSAPRDKEAIGVIEVNVETGFVNLVMAPRKSKTNDKPFSHSQLAETIKARYVRLVFSRQDNSLNIKKIDILPPDGVEKIERFKSILRRDYFNVIKLLMVSFKSAIQNGLMTEQELDDVQVYVSTALHNDLRTKLSADLNGTQGYFPIKEVFTKLEEEDARRSELRLAKTPAIQPSNVAKDPVTQILRTRSSVQGIIQEALKIESEKRRMSHEQRLREISEMIQQIEREVYRSPSLRGVPPKAGRRSNLVQEIASSHQGETRNDKSFISEGEQRVIHNLALFILELESAGGIYKIQRSTKTGKPILESVGMSQISIETLGDMMKRNVLQPSEKHFFIRELALSVNLSDKSPLSSLTRSGIHGFENLDSGSPAGMTQSHFDLSNRALGDQDLKHLVATTRGDPKKIGRALAMSVIQNDRIDLLFLMAHIRSKLRENYVPLTAFDTPQGYYDFYQFYYRTTRTEVSRLDAAFKNSQKYFLSAPTSSLALRSEVRSAELGANLDQSRIKNLSQNWAESVRGLVAAISNVFNEVKNSQMNNQSLSVSVTALNKAIKDIINQSKSEESSAELQVVSTTIEHYFNNPLTLISVLAELDEGEARDEETLELARQSANTLEECTNLLVNLPDVLIFNKDEAINQVMLDLHGMLRASNVMRRSVKNPIPNLRKAKPEYIDWDFFMFISNKDIMRGLSKEGPITQPQWYSFREKNRYWIDPQHLLSDFKTFVSLVRKGEITLPLVLKPNSEALAKGVVFLEDQDSERIKVTLSDPAIDHIKSMKLDDLRKMGVVDFVADEKRSLLSFTLDRSGEQFEKVLNALYEKLKFGMAEEKLEAIKIPQAIESEVLEVAYDTRLYFKGNFSTGKLERLYSKDFAHLGNSSYYVNYTGRPNAAKKLAHETFYPLFDQYPDLQSRKRDFNEYVDRKVQEQFHYLSNRLKATGLDLDINVEGHFDLMWLPPLIEGAFPRPVLIESTLYPLSGMLWSYLTRLGSYYWERFRSLDRNNIRSYQGRSEVRADGVTGQQTTEPTRREQIAEVLGKLRLQDIADGVIAYQMNYSHVANVQELSVTRQYKKIYQEMKDLKWDRMIRGVNHRLKVVLKPKDQEGWGKWSDAWESWMNKSKNKFNKEMGGKILEKGRAELNIAATTSDENAKIEIANKVSELILKTLPAPPVKTKKPKVERPTRRKVTASPAVTQPLQPVKVEPAELTTTPKNVVAQESSSISVQSLDVKEEPEVQKSSPVPVVALPAPVVEPELPKVETEQDLVREQADNILAPVFKHHIPRAIVDQATRAKWVDEITNEILAEMEKQGYDARATTKKISGAMLDKAGKFVLQKQLESAQTFVASELAVSKTDKSKRKTNASEKILNETIEKLKQVIISDLSKTQNSIPLGDLNDYKDYFTDLKLTPDQFNLVTFAFIQEDWSRDYLVDRGILKQNEGIAAFQAFSHFNPFRRSELREQSQADFSSLVTRVNKSGMAPRELSLREKTSNSTAESLSLTSAMSSLRGSNSSARVRKSPRSSSTSTATSRAVNLSLLSDGINSSSTNKVAGSLSSNSKAVNINNSNIINNNNEIIVYLGLMLAPKELGFNREGEFSKEQMVKEIIRLERTGVSIDSIQKALEEQVDVHSRQSIVDRPAKMKGRGPSTVDHSQEMLNPQLLAPLMKQWIASLDQFKNQSFNLGMIYTKESSDAMNALTDGIVQTSGLVDHAIILNSEKTPVPVALTGKLKSASIQYQLIRTILGARKVTLVSQSRLPMMTKGEAILDLDSSLAQVGVSNPTKIYDVLLEGPEGVLQVVLAVHLAALPEEDFKDPELLRKNLAVKLFGQVGESIFDLKRSESGSIQVFIARAELRRFLLQYQAQHAAQVAA